MLCSRAEPGAKSSGWGYQLRVVTGAAVGLGFGPARKIALMGEIVKGVERDNPYSTITIFDDLYVMQNEHGLIKIGRSVNPEVRRSALEIGEHCRIEIVLVLDGKGPREKALHRQLERYRLYGEWFNGTAQARAAIGRTVKRGFDFTWPFELDVDGAEAWLSQLEEWGRQRYIVKEFHGFLAPSSLRRHPQNWTDSVIWRLFWLSETGERAVVAVGGDADLTTYEGCPPGSDQLTPIPNYSSDLAVAMTLWPDDVRPSGWDGTAFECCVAALRVRHYRLPRGWVTKPRTGRGR